PRRAVEEAVFAAAVSDATAAIAGADLVVLAASPAANLALVERLGPALAAAGGLVTDLTNVPAPSAARAGAGRPRRRRAHHHPRPAAGRGGARRGGRVGARLARRPVARGPGLARRDATPPRGCPARGGHTGHERQ